MDGDGAVAITQSVLENPDLCVVDKLLTPITTREFFDRWWGKSFLRVPGKKGKFQSLLTWPELSAIVTQHRMQSPRITLVKGTKRIDSKQYLGIARNYREPKLRTWDLQTELSSGATLIINSFDDLHASVQRVAESLECILRTVVYVNLYAGWGAENAFNLHWDDQDTLIVQVAGRKSWKVYQPTTAYPCRRDKLRVPEPQDSPVWEGVVEDGDLLYMPRGWWHVATPINEPTLHLTVSVENPNGMDLLHWFAEKLVASPLLRMDVPLLATKDEQLDYLNGVVSELNKSWGPDLLTAFGRERDSLREPRQALSLPWLPPSGDGHLPPMATVRLAIPRPLHITSSPDGTIEFEANGKGWRYGEVVRKPLETLSDHRMHRLIDLCPDDQATIETALIELWRGGIIEILDESDSPQIGSDFATASDQ